MKFGVDEMGKGKAISIVLFFVVICVVGSLGYFLYRSTQIDPFNVKITKNETVPLLWSFGYPDEAGENHIISFLVLFDSTVKQIGVLEIPPYLAIHDEENDSYTAIDSYYKKGDYDLYHDVLEKELQMGEIHYLFVDMQMVENFVDFLGGVRMIMIETDDPVSSEEDEIIARIGTMMLDGIDVAQYIRNIEISKNTMLFKSSQRKEYMFSLLRQLQEESHTLISSPMVNRMRTIVHTSLTSGNIERMHLMLSEYNIRSVYYQRVNGTMTDIEGSEGVETVLFIHSEIGTIARIAQFFSKQIKESTQQKTENKITVTILNGTVINGLARKTKALYEEGGFQVLSIGNAIQQNIKKTVVIDRTGNQDQADLAAALIHTRNIITDVTSVDSAGASITIVLGEDFDGKRVR